MAAGETDAGNRFAAVPPRVRWFFGVAGRRQTYYNLGYLLLSFPLGLAYFVAFTIGIALGIGLAILLVGVGILALTFVFGLAVASGERWLTVRLLDVTIPRQTSFQADSRLGQIKALLLNRSTWTSLVYLPVKFVLGVVTLAFVTTGIPTVIAMLMVPLYYDQPGLYVGVVTDRAPEIHQTIYLGWNYLLVGVEAVFIFGYWQIDGLGGALIVAVFGFLGIFVFLHLTNLLAWIWGRWAAWSLGGSYDLPAMALHTDSTEE